MDVRWCHQKRYSMLLASMNNRRSTDDSPNIPSNDISADLERQMNGLRKQSDISLCFDNVSQDVANASSPFFIPSEANRLNSKKGSPISGSPHASASDLQISSSPKSRSLKNSMREMSSHLRPGTSGEVEVRP